MQIAAPELGLRRLGKEVPKHAAGAAPEIQHATPRERVAVGKQLADGTLALPPS